MVDLHATCGCCHSVHPRTRARPSLRSMPETAPTSVNVTGPVRAATAALTTTAAVSVPVFLVGGLAVQISQDLDFSAAGLGLAVSAYFGATALASVPAGALVERYGATAVSRCGIALSA